MSGPGAPAVVLSGLGAPNVRLRTATTMAMRGRMTARDWGLLLPVAGVAALTLQVAVMLLANPSMLDRLLAPPTGREVLALFVGALWTWFARSGASRVTQRGTRRAMREQEERVGPVSVVVDPQGHHIEAPAGRITTARPWIDAVAETRDGLALIGGGWVFPIPDDTLPDGLARSDLRARIDAWRREAEAET